MIDDPRTQLWYQPEDYIVDVVRKLAGDVEPKVWRCPCREGCANMVAYAKSPSSGAVWFRSNMSLSSSTEAGVFAIENVEDFETFLSDDRNPDAGIYALWFAAGLRDALLEAL